MDPLDLLDLVPIDVGSDDDSDRYGCVFWMVAIVLVAVAVVAVLFF